MGHRTCTRLFSANNAITGSHRRQPQESFTLLGPFAVERWSAICRKSAGCLHVRDFLDIDVARRDWARKAREKILAMSPYRREFGAAGGSIRLWRLCGHLSRAVINASAVALLYNRLRDSIGE